MIHITQEKFELIVNGTNYPGLKLEIGAYNDPVCLSNCTFVDQHKLLLKETKKLRSDSPNIKYQVANIIEGLPF